MPADLSASPLMPLLMIAAEETTATPIVAATLEAKVRINAHSDADAVRQWLMEYRESPRTLRHYRKEAERLLLWLNDQELSLAAMTREHLDQFDAFLSNPQPSSRWIGTVCRRSAPGWRPFRGPLSAASRRQALIILQGLFGWLREAGWVSHNPFQLMRNKRQRLDNRQPVVERYLERSLWQWLWGWLQQPSLRTPPSAAYALERQRFAVGFGYLMAARVSEMAAARMNDFIEREGRWWWQVVGKGQKWARVPVPPAMMTLLKQWRYALGLSEYPLEHEDTPLLRTLNGQQGITDNQLYRLLRHTFQSAAAALAKEPEANPYYIQQLQAATPHWLRHTALTHQAQEGVEMRYLAQTARHTSLETTARYLHTEAAEWHQQLAQHGRELFRQDTADTGRYDELAERIETAPGKMPSNHKG